MHRKSSQSLRPIAVNGARPLAAAISAILATAGAMAEETNNVLDTVTVTATRRSESIQDVPLNIAAVSSASIEERGIGNLAELSRSVPGLFVLDQGPRGANAIVVRGLNADPVNGTEALGNGGGGTVATYVGEIPLYVDLKLEDIERVEVLLGPQGTLYGAGTLGGAIRYIPKRPQFDELSLDLRARGYTLSHSGGVGGSGGFTLNIPMGGNFAFRASVDYLDDPGFIDYDYVVREAGVSDPEPDFANPAAVSNNLRKVKDADWQHTLSGRAGFRWQLDKVDANLTYYYQDQDVGGRTQNNQASFGTGPYTSAGRYEEPSDRKNQLGALEITADLGFAELTSATGFSKYDEHGQRDQTDLLITLDYSYEAFPTFSAYTREDQRDETFNQELRLVSTSEGRLKWIAGAFFNRQQSDAVSQEFTPHFSQFLLDSGRATGLLRPDALEYYSLDETNLKEMAAYGELSFNFTDAWQVTVGGRWYKYDLKTKDDADFPLAETTYSGRTPVDAVVLNLEEGGQKDDGFLYKFNTSYQFTTDIMAYLTVSEGYRIGNSNGLALCDAASTIQGSCATPREYQYFPDKTTNYEIGWRTQFFDRRLTVNGAIYYIDWEDPQLGSATVTGAIPITINGAGAATRGAELQIDARVTERFTLNASYAYVQAELTQFSEDLVRAIEPPGFDTVFEDGQAGDRLPGSPEHQGSLFATYALPIGGQTLDFNYGVTAISDVITRTGTRGGGEALGGFSLHSASLVLHGADWNVSLYGKNLLDKYAETGVRSTSRFVQTVNDDNGDPVRVRSYAKDVVRPREVGLQFNYKFDF